VSESGGFAVPRSGITAVVLGDCIHEGTSIGKEDMRKMQGDPPQGSRLHPMHESQAQAATGLNLKAMHQVEEVTIG
jgi:hypothetical protein